MRLLYKDSHAFVFFFINFYFENLFFITGFAVLPSFHFLIHVKVFLKKFKSIFFTYQSIRILINFNTFHFSRLPLKILLFQSIEKPNYLLPYTEFQRLHLPLKISYQRFLLNLDCSGSLTFCH